MPPSSNSPPLPTPPRNARSFWYALNNFIRTDDHQLQLLAYDITKRILRLSPIGLRRWLTRDRNSAIFTPPLNIKILGYILQGVIPLSLLSSLPAWEAAPPSTPRDEDVRPLNAQSGTAINGAAAGSTTATVNHDEAIGAATDATNTTFSTRDTDAETVSLTTSSAGTPANVNDDTVASDVTSLSAHVVIGPTATTTTALIVGIVEDSTITEDITAASVTAASVTAAAQDAVHFAETDTSVESPSTVPVESLSVVLVENVSTTVTTATSSTVTDETASSAIVDSTITTFATEKTVAHSSVTGETTSDEKPPARRKGKNIRSTEELMTTMASIKKLGATKLKIEEELLQRRRRA
ncbi:hypothetical protein BG015_010040 [Linnemannia schmuckeri]|uniref:Uncharacterized protein n=1 Tax=Linnemannia schmuckeri TaxID=64567 RepID=A0A9P5VEM6_9FUNG|nr:hypothetical protein BG015_010040 [Linnemannia schmuckeri]